METASYPTLDSPMPTAGMPNFNFTGREGAANRLFLLGKGVKFFELPAKKGCGVNDTASKCSLMEGCEWTKFLLPEFNFCRPIRQKSQVEDKIEEAIRRSQDIIGFTPTTETINQLATQTYETVRDEGKKMEIAQERAVATQLGSHIVNKLATTPSWATTPFSSGGGCGILDIKSYSVEEHTPIGEGSTAVIYPGDVIVYGYGTDYTEFSGNKFTRKWVVYLGRFPSTNGWYEDWGVLADGENYESAEAFVRNALEQAKNEPYSYNMAGMVRPINLNSMVKPNMIQRDRVNIPASDKRPLLDIVIGALSAVGVFTFQLAKSNSQHFAMYIVTGKWTSLQAEKYTDYIQKSRPKGWLFGPGAAPTSPVVEPTKDMTKSGEFCAFKSPLRCLFHEDMQAYKEFEDQETQLAIYQTSLKELTEKGKPVKQMYLPDDIYEKMLSNFNADVKVLEKKMEDIETWLNERAEFLKQRLNDYLLIKTEERYFCWQKKDFAEIIMKQVLSGHIPHDPVLLHAISPEDYLYITGTSMPDELRTLAEEKTRSGSSAARVVRDESGVGPERRGRMRRGVPYTTRKLAAPVSPVTLPLQEKEKRDMALPQAAFNAPAGFFTEAPTPSMFLSPTAPSFDQLQQQ